MIEEKDKPKAELLDEFLKLRRLPDITGDTMPDYTPKWNWFNENLDVVRESKNEFGKYHLSLDWCEPVLDKLEKHYNIDVKFVKNNGSEKGVLAYSAIINFGDNISIQSAKTRACALFYALAEVVTFHNASIKKIISHV